uniref:CCHC-type domain-containing protein n=1 Tax=Astyanax mexicanus TaxID=7994 RepID=A0A8B9HA17_ASTMX
ERGKKGTDRYGSRVVHRRCKNVCADRGQKAVIMRGGRGSQVQANSDTQCYRCGMGTHTADECGAKTATCLFCKKTGHYARMCFKKKKKQQTERNSDTCKNRNKGKEKIQSGKPVRAVIQDASDSDSDEFIHAVDPEGTETVKING